MKTLSIKQPYAQLIAEGIKDVENRSQKTNYRGTVLIHASGTWHDRARDMSTMYTRAQYDSLLYAGEFERYLIQTGFLTSAIIGQVDIVDCVQDSGSIWAEPGAWHWVLKNAKVFVHPIIEVKGALSFWNFEPGKLDKMTFDTIKENGGLLKGLFEAKIFINDFSEGRKVTTFVEGNKTILKLIQNVNG